MKATEIKDLLEYISKSGLEEVQIETPELKLNIKRSNVVTTVAAAPVAVAAPVAAAPAPVAALAPAAAPVAAAPAAAPAPAVESGVTVKSPMIGTFYQSPSPDKPAFVKEGDMVKKGQVLCIIEAMKLFNEIESEVSGKLVKILVPNATPVEYDQPLFLIEAQ